MRKLYEINADIERLLDENSVLKLEGGQAVDTETGEIFSLAERLDALEVEKSEKLESVAIYLDDLVFKGAAIDERIKYLQALKKSLQGQTERLGEYLLYATENKGFEGKNVSVKVTKSQRVIIEDESLVEPHFQKVETKITPDKVAIKNALKDGVVLPYAQLKTFYSVKVK